VLAAALVFPVYAMFCTRRGPRFRVEFSMIAEKVTLPRARRAEAVAAYAQAFAQRLEAAVEAAPFHWFNFYPFWPDVAATPAPDLQSRTAMAASA
jgi:predicted LPLAT superfamily acyltransferase